MSPSWVDIATLALQIVVTLVAGWWVLSRWAAPNRSGPILSVEPSDKSGHQTVWSDERAYATLRVRNDTNRTIRFGRLLVVMCSVEEEFNWPFENDSSFPEELLPNERRMVSYGPAGVLEPGISLFHHFQFDKGMPTTRMAIRIEYGEWVTKWWEYWLRSSRTEIQRTTLFIPAQ